MVDVAWLAEKGFEKRYDSTTDGLSLLGMVFPQELYCLRAGDIDILLAQLKMPGKSQWFMEARPRCAGRPAGSDDYFGVARDQNALAAEEVELRVDHLFQSVQKNIPPEDA